MLELNQKPILFQHSARYHFPNIKRREDGSQKQGYKPKIIRYADDFVVLHEDYEVILQCKHLIAQWLRKIGL